MAKGKHKQVDEKRLKSAYDAGYFDGYHEGIDDAHGLWVSVLRKRDDFDDIMKEVTAEAERRAKERGVEHNEIRVNDDGEVAVKEGSHG